LTVTSEMTSGICCLEKETRTWHCKSYLCHRLLILYKTAVLRSCSTSLPHLTANNSFTTLLCTLLLVKTYLCQYSTVHNSNTLILFSSLVKVIACHKSLYPTNYLSSQSVPYTLLYYRIQYSTYSTVPLRYLQYHSLLYSTTRLHTPLYTLQVLDRG